MNVRVASVTFLLALGLSGSVIAAESPMDLLETFGKISERASILKKIRSESERLGLLPKSKNAELEWDQIETNTGMTTVKTSLRLDGIPVVGAGMSYHVTANGFETFSNDIPSLISAPFTPKISIHQALAIAALRSSNPLRAEPELKLLPSTDRTRLDLVWWVDFRSTDFAHPGLEVVIDANSGKVFAEISKQHSVRGEVETEIYNAHESGLKIEFITEDGSLIVRKEVKEALSRIAADGLDPETASENKIIGCRVTNLDTKKSDDIPIQYCVATIQGLNDIGAKACQIINPLDGSFFAVRPKNCELYARNGKVVGAADVSAANAADNATEVYQYYSDRFGRRSFDGNGSVLTSVVKVGMGWNNAAWSSDLNFMSYGFGDGKHYGDFTQLVDVAGHEMTHGVVNATAKLTMQDEPGALNEATADYFGLQISRYNDWIIGKGLYLDHPEQGLRSIWKPSMYSDEYLDDVTGKRKSKPNPEKYSERYQTKAECNGKNDRCFVHMNSTVMSHGYYWIHRALGKSKTQDLIFLALTQYYRPNTNFHDAAKALREACDALTKQGRLQGDDCTRVDAALVKVEL